MAQTHVKGVVLDDDVHVVEDVGLVAVLVAHLSHGNEGGVSISGTTGRCSCALGVFGAGWGWRPLCLTGKPPA